MEKIILKGLINYSGEWDDIYIGNTYLRYFAEDFDDKIVKATYYISDNELTDENHELAFLTSYYNGTSSTDGSYCYGSSWTGCYAKNDEFLIGNRDVIHELSSFIGKHCYFILSVEK